MWRPKYGKMPIRFWICLVGEHLPLVADLRRRNFTVAGRVGLTRMIRYYYYCGLGTNDIRAPLLSV